MEMKWQYRINDKEKRFFKDQTEEIKKLELILREKTKIIDEPEMSKFNLEEQVVPDQRVILRLS